MGVPVNSSTTVFSDAATLETASSLAEMSIDILNAASNTSWGGFYPNLQIPVVTFYPLGQAPDVSGDISMDIPETPEEPVLGNVSDFVLPSSPVLDATAPLVSSIQLPDPFTESLSGEPSLMDVSVPIATDIVLPEVPTFVGLNIPSVPEISMPVFNEVTGDLPVSPDVTFSWAEIDYDSNVLVALKNKLFSVVSGLPTGFSEKTELAIWNVARDAENISALTRLEDGTVSYASKGFNFHGGKFVQDASSVVSDSILKISEASRTIMRDQADLEHKNKMLAMNTSLALEAKLMDKHRRAQARLFEAVKFSLDAALKIFAAEVNLYVADVKIFAVNAEVFKTRLQAELVKLEVYKAKLEGLKAEARLNEVQVKLYSARISGLLLLVDEYRSKIESAAVIIGDYDSRIRLFASKTKGIAAIVDAKSAEYKNYSEAVKGEVSKVRSIAIQADAFRSQVDAFKTLTSALASKQEIAFKQHQKLPLDKYKAQIEAFKTRVDAETKRVAAIAQVLGSRIEAYSVEERSKSKDMSLQAGAMAAVAKGYLANANASVGAADASARISAAQISLAATTDAARMQISAMESAAGISAKTTNFSTNESISESVSESCSSSKSKNSSCITSSSIRQDFNGMQVSVAETMGAYWIGGPNITPADLNGGGCGC